MATVEEKSMVPTVLVGIGGTGTEVLARVRRLVEETYGSLDNFPIISFLTVDTDKDYKINNPQAGGTPFKDNEKLWAKVGGKQVREMVSHMENYPWINSWFPSELERNITSLEAGAGQIRACGRFALFCNYHAIQKKFLEAVNRIKGRENFMLEKYGIKVTNNAINVFVTGSLSGGTGSGMLIDMGYCLRHWLKGEGSPLVTAIVPTPEAFAGINVGDRVLANGYAALMELNYYSDHRTEYVQQFSGGTIDELRSKLAPFDFTYLVGTKNGENDFKLEQIREMIAQNIFLDLTSDFAPHKRSIRDNIKAAWAQADPGGRGYSKQFMSFGLSTIEIPIAHIRASLCYRLATDLINWWFNEGAVLPAQMLDLVKDDILKRMRLTERELLADLAAAQDRPYFAVISEWVNSIRQEIMADNLLQCTQEGINMIGTEKGKILQFVDGYLKPKVDGYRIDHFRELSPDERLHGDFLKKIYSNRDESIQRGRKALEEEFYRILEDPTRGPKFADAFLVSVRQVFEDAAQKFRREQDKVWAPNETNRQCQYEGALQEIEAFKDRFGLTKKEKMEQDKDRALEGLEGSLIATIQRKIRAAGLEVIGRLQEHLTTLENRFNRWKQKLIQGRDLFKARADSQADSADALIINGLKLYDRQELNLLYQDFIERLAGGSTGKKSTYEIGMDSICRTMSEDILREASPLWKETRTANEVMRLFDLTELPDVLDEDFQEIIVTQSKDKIDKAPQNSRLKTDLAACDRLFKIYNDDSEIVNNIRVAYHKSEPLILLNKAVLQGKDAGFTPAKNINVAVLGGRNTSDPAAEKLLPKIQEFVTNDDEIKPLGYPERHRIVFVQEMGGFSLRCIDGMRELRNSYQDWRGEFIVAKRAQQAGESRDLPVPVHIQKEPPFWDLFPEDPAIFRLVIQARALKVLQQATNKATDEKVIRYQIQTATGVKNIDLASTWEDVTQVLEVKACRDDRQEIQRQLTAKLNACTTDIDKYRLYQQLLKYLEQRALELETQGGKDSLEYKREDRIILDLIEKYKLNIQGDKPVKALPKKPNQLPPEEPANIPTQLGAKNQGESNIFCNKCGAKNPDNYNFCFKCGSKLIKVAE
jgi:ribosomal protein L40E